MSTRSISTSSRLLAAVLMAIVASCLAASSSGGASAPPGVSRAPTVTQAAAATVQATSNPAAAGGAIDVCAIVTVADVQPFVRDPVTASPRTDLTGEASGCEFATAADVNVEVTTVSGDQAATAWAEQADTGIALSGVGDQAVREPGSAIMWAIKGSVMCSVDISDSQASSYVGLASEDANGNIPDDSANSFSQKLGALCNKIFAAQ